MFRSRFPAMLVGSSLCAVLAAMAFAIPARALSSDSLALPGIPWWERIVRSGIALEVDLAPLDPAPDGGLRESERVALRFHLSDAATGLPLTGLTPAAWLEPVPAGEPFDAESCTSGGAAALAPGRPLPALGEDARGGTYEAVARFGGAGRYEVFFLLPEPRIVHCFQVEVRGRG
jgi:hypothetical protein